MCRWFGTGLAARFVPQGALVGNALLFYSFHGVNGALNLHEPKDKQANIRKEKRRGADPGVRRGPDPKARLFNPWIRNFNFPLSAGKIWNKIWGLNGLAHPLLVPLENIFCSSIAVTLSYTEQIDKPQPPPHTLKWAHLRCTVSAKTPAIHQGAASFTVWDILNSQLGPFTTEALAGIPRLPEVLGSDLTSFHIKLIVITANCLFCSFRIGK